MTPIDMDVVEALAKEDLEERIGVLAERYRRVFEAYGSGREADSALNHWRFAESAWTIARNGDDNPFERLVAALDPARDSS